MDPQPNLGDRRQTADNQDTYNNPKQFIMNQASSNMLSEVDLTNNSMMMYHATANGLMIEKAQDVRGSQRG